MIACGRRTSTRLDSVRPLTAHTLRRRAVPVVPILCAFLSAIACGAPPRAPGTVVMASGTDLESGNPLVTVHPLSRQLQRHALFVTLVRLDSTLSPVPYYASRWQWDSARTSVVFALVSTLRWHDGAPTTARDVQFTFDAVRDSSLGSPRAGDVAAISSIDAINDTTVRVNFSHAMPTLPTIFAELPIIPKHILDTVPRARWRGHAFATAPVGNGPFRFVDRVAGRRWRFARNDKFPPAMGGPPQLQQLVVAVVDEASTKFAGLVSGELDVAGVSPTMASLVRADPTLELLTPPALFSTVLAFNSTRPPFNDARVRRATALCIDRRRIVQAAVAGYATPSGGAIPPGLPIPVAVAEPPDTLRADRLLDAAGWRRSTSGVRTRNAQPLAVTLLTVGSSDQAVEQLVQADLQACGIRTDIRVVELASFLTTLRATHKTFDVALTGIPGDIALGQLTAMFASTQRGGALDYTGFHAPVLDFALERARNAAPQMTAQAWQEVDALLIDSMPVAWLYHARGVQGKSRRLEHVFMDLRGELTSVAQWTRRDSL